MFQVIRNINFVDSYAVNIDLVVKIFDEQKECVRTKRFLGVDRVHARSCKTTRILSR